MDDVIKIRVYHGTDRDNAEAICNDKFICKDNREHWLGNGIYFYTDEALARWWTTNPTNKFGATIKTPAIVTCDLEIPYDNLLDMTQLDGYTKYVEYFNAITNSLLFKRRLIGDTRFKQARCSFFDSLFAIYDLSAIIGAFNIPEQPYIPQFDDTLFSSFKITYTELQVCIHEERQDVIKRKSIMLV